MMKMNKNKDENNKKKSKWNKKKKDKRDKIKKKKTIKGEERNRKEKKRYWGTSQYRKIVNRGEEIASQRNDVRREED